MLEESGKVVALDGEQAWVQTIRTSACSSCQARSGCGQGVLASISDGKANQVLVKNTLNLSVGDEVQLGVPEDMLLKASMVVYLIPLVSMIVAAVVADKWLLVSDGWSVLAGVVGLSIGFLFVKLYSSYYSNDQRFCPKMITGLPINSPRQVRLD